MKTMNIGLFFMLATTFSFSALAGESCLKSFEQKKQEVVLSKKEASALEEKLQEIIDETDVVNGDSSLEDFDVQKFSLDQAKADLAESRPDVYDGLEEKPESLMQTFETTVGFDAVLKRLKSDHDMDAKSDATVAEIVKLQKKGLIKEILVRDTKEMISETYLIPIFIDIYIEYTVNGKKKGKMMQLHYEVGA